MSDVILPGAIKPKADLDVVVYEGGERIVLGKATVHADGSMVATMDAAAPESVRWAINIGGSGHYTLLGAAALPRTT